MFYASPVSILLSEEMSDKESAETYSVVSNVLENQFGSRFATYYALEIKHTSQFLTLFLPLVSDNQTIGQSYANITLLQRINPLQVYGSSRSYLCLPELKDYFILAGLQSFFSYAKLNMRRLVTGVQRELSNIFDIHNGDEFLQNIQMNVFGVFSWNVLIDVMKSYFGDTNAGNNIAVEITNALIKLLRDIHKLFFFFDYSYYLIVYRLLSIRNVTSSSPRQKVKYLMILFSL